MKKEKRMRDLMRNKSRIIIVAHNIDHNIIYVYR